jgi:hypothetical protein
MSIILAAQFFGSITVIANPYTNLVVTFATYTNRTSEGYGFSEKPTIFKLSTVNGGPPNSTKTLRIQKLHDNSGFNYVQFFWAGPRSGSKGYIKEAKHANSHSVWVRGFDELTGDRRGNMNIGGYTKQRTPKFISMNEPESHNMHNYFQIKVDWGGSPGMWREIVVRNNPNVQRGSQHMGGYEPFLAHTELWPDQTRLYWAFYGKGADANNIYMDNFIWFYENPYLAAFPQMAVRYATAGDKVTQPVIVWNTHPTATRSFLIKISGWHNSGVEWRGGRGKKAIITSSSGILIKETGPIKPGEGFVFNVIYSVPLTDKHGNPQKDGNRGVLLISVYQNPAQIPDPYPYQKPNPIKNMLSDRFDLPGVGIAIKTVVASIPGRVQNFRSVLYPYQKPNPIKNMLSDRFDLPGVGIATKTVVASIPGQAGTPTAVIKLRATEVGGSWVDLEWISPAKYQFPDETANDPSILAYAIRYSQDPITNNTSWNEAVPVESAPPVFGSEIPQRYSIRGLRFDTQYTAAVRTYNEKGVGSIISFVSFTTAVADVDMGKSKHESSKNISPSVFVTDNSRIYHKSDCPELGTSEILEFNSANEALKAGSMPCEKCN